MAKNNKPKSKPYCYPYIFYKIKKRFEQAVILTGDESVMKGNGGLFYNEKNFKLL